MIAGRRSSLVSDSEKSSASEWLAGKEISGLESFSEVDEKKIFLIAIDLKFAEDFVKRLKKEIASSQDNAEQKKAVKIDPSSIVNDFEKKLEEISKKIVEKAIKNITDTHISRDYVSGDYFFSSLKTIATQINKVVLLLFDEKNHPSVLK